MKVLGYPWTWPTSCFIGVNNIGCGAATFAHTNGDGDFVLFDSLGPPWPIHKCYLIRAKLLSASARWTLSVKVQPPKPKKVWTTASDIQRADPALFLDRASLHIVGKLQEHHSGKRDEWLGKVRGLAKQVLWKVLEKHPDQLTMVTGDPDAGLQSFTAFADLSKLRLGKKKAMIRATFRAVPAMIQDKPFVFLADDVSLLPF